MGCQFLAGCKKNAAVNHFTLTESDKLEGKIEGSQDVEMNALIEKFSCSCQWPLHRQHDI